MRCYGKRENAYGCAISILSFAIRISRFRGFSYGRMAYAYGTAISIAKSAITTLPTA